MSKNGLETVQISDSRGTVDEKEDQKKWRITKTWARDQQQNGMQQETIKAHQIMFVDETGINEIVPLEIENEEEQEKEKVLEPFISTKLMSKANIDR